MARTSTRPADIDKALLARADGVTRELRRQGLVARTVHLKVRTGDFETVTRARTLSEPTDLAEVVLAAARELFRERVFLKGAASASSASASAASRPPARARPPSSSTSGRRSCATSRGPPTKSGRSSARPPSRGRASSPAEPVGRGRRRERGGRSRRGVEPAERRLTVGVG